MKRRHFKSRAYVLNNIVNSDTHKGLLQSRPSLYKFGTQNYGEIQGLVNRADGDCWDIFAPGYSSALPTECAYKIKTILGVYTLQNGNDKIAVRLFEPGFDPDICEKEIATFCRLYTAHTGIRGVWLPITPA